MMINGTYRFGNLICKFQLKIDSFFTTLEGKLNSYKVQADQYDLLVCNSEEQVDLSTFTLINEESTGFFKRQIYVNEKSKIFQIIRTRTGEVYVRYLFQDHTARLLIDKTNDGGYFAFDYLVFIINEISLQRNTLPLHGVLMEFNSSGLIISADSGVGKSTHARLWRDYEHAFIINGDRSFIHKEDNKWIGVGYPWCGSSGEYMNRSVPIKAIVMLKRGTENKAYQISPKEALPQVLGQVFYPSYDFNATLKVLDMLDELLRDVPVYQLECDISKEAVEVLKEAIFNE